MSLPACLREIYLFLACFKHCLTAESQCAKGNHGLRYHAHVCALMCRQPLHEQPDSAVVLDIARDGREAGQLRLSLAPNQRCVFGRHPGSCDVVLEHLSISRQHAHLAMDLSRHCFITDMGSGDLHPSVSVCVMHAAAWCCLWLVGAAYTCLALLLDVWCCPR